MNCDNMRGCCSPCSQLAQQLEETNTRAVQAYNLAAQAFAAVIPPQGGSNIDVTLVPGPAYEIALKNPMDDDVVINADLTVNGDIYQNGSAYESHAEQLYTTKDTVIMRDGATTGLAPGDVAGLIMKKYDGTNDGALVVGNDGTARVGDVGSEQPLLTRSESAQLNNGDLLQWNGTDQKAVSASLNTSQIVRGSGNIGSDTKPVKVVGGVATEISAALATELYATNPNQLVNNVNDWLSVNLNNKDSDVNRTTVLTDSVTTNRPQQAGDSVYCYFGTRFVFWQANGFVTVFVVGQGTDSAAHIWIDNYNANAGGWVGWKRVF